MTRLSFEITEDEFERFQQLAQASRMSLSEWARHRLRNDPRAAPDVMEEAFRRLDESDSNFELTDGPPPPVAPVTFEARLSVFGKPLPTDHVCVHHAELERTDGGPPKVCGNSGQLGRPCYFSSNRAADCIYFSPRGRG